jgi:hypothetical protein
MISYKIPLPSRERKGEGEVHLPLTPSRQGRANHNEFFKLN